ncbi:hypothetical protein SH528x_002158 [Novipirellula sp. SH528]|uniref:hypothetical protein n=1 Tax=Novipirellula sp. SH528 TaxID=3454466 RepID=UPI003FA18162
MRKQRTLPNFSASLLDLLCSALGGVALMVFLFAAMRRNAEADAGMELQRRLQIEILKPYDFLRVGDSVSLQVRDAEGFEVLLPHNVDLEANDGSGKLILRRPKSSSSKFLIEIRSRENIELALDVWLRRLELRHLSGPDASSFQRLLRGDQELKFRVMWVSNQETKSPDQCILNASNRFYVRDVQLGIAK